MAYHIIISSVDGSVGNSYLYRPGSAPEYVQKYMTMPALCQTESVPESENDRIREIDQKINFDLSLLEMKNIYREDESCENLEEKFTGQRVRYTGNWSSKEMAYHITISSVSGSILNSSLCRPESAPDYVQNYMTIPATSHTGPEMKNIYQEDECCENLKGSFTESENAKDSIKQVICVLNIYGPNGNVLETSYQPYDQALPLIQQCLMMELDFGLSPNNDSWNGGKKLVFRKHVYVCRKSKSEYTEANYLTKNSNTETSKQTPNDPSRKRSIIIWVICLIVFPKAAKASECLESLSTVTLTPSCPTTEKQWTEKALLKRCSSHSQLCSSSSDYVYHCLVNAFGNATVEVCAPKIRTSYCVEFNSLGARIQANFHSKCTNTTTDCGMFYNSNEMYKVPQCYSSFNEHSMPYKLSETTIPHPLQSTTIEIETTDSYTTINHTGHSRKTDKNSNGPNRQWTNTIVGIIMITIFILINVLLITLMIMKKKKLKKSYLQTDIETAKNMLSKCYHDQEDR